MTGKNTAKRGVGTAGARGRRARAAAIALLLGTGATMALCGQTLARPGWAGSGLTVAQWWRNAVLFEVQAPAKAGGPPVLATLLTRMEDLQLLGADAVLLRGVMAPGGAGGAMPLAPGYGTPDQFDQVLQQASQHRVRLLVELPPTLSGDALSGAARFWLSRGVSGVYLPSAPGAAVAAQRATLRSVLRGYVGQRVLVGDADAGADAGAADLTLRTLHGFGALGVDVRQLRSDLQAARKAGPGESVEGIDPAAPAATGETARARVSALMMVAGGVALRLQDTGEGPEAQARGYEAAGEARDAALLAAATSPAGVSNARRAIAARKAVPPPVFKGDAVFQWTERMVGMHRGNPAMLLGSQTFPDFDAQAVLVSVWQGRSGPVLAETVSFAGTPVQVSLQEAFAAMHLRGSFLRPVARTDAGMGAMPLRAVKLAPFGVYLGELGR